MPAFNVVEFLRFSAHWLVASPMRMAVFGGGLLTLGVLLVVRFLDWRHERLEYEASRRRIVRSIAAHEYRAQAHSGRSLSLLHRLEDEPQPIELIEFGRMVRSVNQQCERDALDRANHGVR